MGQGTAQGTRGGRNQSSSMGPEPGQPLDQGRRRRRRVAAEAESSGSHSWMEQTVQDPCRIVLQVCREWGICASLSSRPHPHPAPGTEPHHRHPRARGAKPSWSLPSKGAERGALRASSSQLCQNETGIGATKPSLGFFSQELLVSLGVLSSRGVKRLQGCLLRPLSPPQSGAGVC